MALSRSARRPSASDRASADAARLECALTESEARLRALLDSSLDCVITIDHEGTILEFNVAAEETFGHRAADVLGKELADILIPPAHRASHRAGLARWGADGPQPDAGGIIGRRIEVTALRADDSEFPVELAIARLELPGPPIFVASLRDITESKEAEAQLREAENRYRDLIEGLPLTVYIDSPDGAGRPPLYVSPQIEALSGHPADEWLIRPGLFAECLHPDDRRRVLAMSHESYKESQPIDEEYRFVRPDGEIVWISDRSSPLAHTASGTLRQGFAVDITQRKLAEEALRDAEQRYRSLVEQLPLVTYVDALDDESSNLYTSPQIEGLLGYAVADWRSDHDLFVKLLYHEDRERVLEAHARSHATGEPLCLDYRLVARDGRIVWLRDESVVLKNEMGTPLVRQGYLLDITERKQADDLLRHQAFHDPLTGLANRALFADRVEHATLRANDGTHEIAVLFLDLDDFKTVNDSLGHGAGDELLVAVSERMLDCLRPGDTVARLGGDEFAVLVEEVAAPADAAQVAERIAEALRPPFVVGGRDVFVSASIGIAFGNEAAELMRAADLAMYRAKSAGKARYTFYEQSMDNAALTRLERTAELQEAIASRQFIAHYQPIIDLGGERIVAVEALLRWQHPRLGLVSPLDFIPLAEETGLIVPLGRWVLSAACDQAAQWNAADRSLAVNVNVSGRQLVDPSFVNDVASILASSRLPAEQLVLEITESIVMENRETSLPALHRLHALGVRLALDDFGIGSSSLASLRDLPVDIVKIDRSFVTCVDAGEHHKAVIAGIVTLGRAFGLELVAEGIERESQAAHMLGLGCPLGQGYLFSRPLPSHELTALLERADLESATARGAAA